MNKVDAQVYACWHRPLSRPAQSGAAAFRSLQKFAGEVKNSNAAMFLPGLDSVSSQ